jgi:hypothetical protein
MDSRKRLAVRQWFSNYQYLALCVCQMMKMNGGGMLGWECNCAGGTGSLCVHDRYTNTTRSMSPFDFLCNYNVNPPQFFT